MAWNLCRTASVWGALALLLHPIGAYGQDIGAADTTEAVSPRFGVDFNSPRSGDDERSYGRATGFIPLEQTPGSGLTFLDTAVRINSTGDFGGTLTLGQRFLKDDLVLGGHLSYDVRDTGINTFNQLGLGIEAYGDRWDVHLNGYLPIGDTQQSAGSIRNGPIGSARFRGNQLVVVTASESDFLESAWGGVDWDAGMQLATWEDWGELWGYGGVYYHGDAIGGRLRLDHRKDWLRLGLGIQSDDNFGTQGFFSVGFNWGGGTGPGDDPTGESALWARVAESVTRNSSIVIKESEVSGVEAAIDPATGIAYSFQHVVPQAGTTGDGTIESPYGSLAVVEAQAGDIVYVAVGDSRTNPLTPFVAPADVSLISTALAQSVATQFGDIPLPGAGDGIYPLIDANGADAGIAVTGSSRVAGFEVSGASRGGIIASDAPGAIIENNIGRLNQAAIVVEGTSTGAIVRNNQLDSHETGISVDTSAEVLVQNNQITNNSGLGIRFIDTVNGTIDGNIMIGISDAAIGVFNSNGVTIRNNQISRVNTIGGTEGAAIVTRDVSGELTISDNTVVGVGGAQLVGGRGIVIVNNTGDVNLTMANNTVRRTLSDGVLILLAGDGLATVNITDNVVEGSGGGLIITRGTGILIRVDENREVTQLAITNNTITDNADDGLSIAVGQSQPSGNSNAVVRNATVSGNVIINTRGDESMTVGGFGASSENIILSSFGDNGSLAISVEANTLINNDGSGVKATSSDRNADGTTNLCLALINNTSNSGYEFEEFSGSTFTLVNRDTVAVDNTGPVVLLPAATSFDTVADISSCP